MVETPFGPSPLTDSTLARLACEHLLKAGCPARTLLRASGLPLSVMERPEIVGAVQQASFLERAARELDDDLLGFHLAEDLDGRVFGPFFHLLASCADLGEALTKQARYLTTVNRALRCHVSEGAAPFVLSLALEGVDRALAEQEMAFWVTFVVQMARTLTTLNLAPAGVSFAQGPPVGGFAMDDYFRCEPVFGAPADGVAFERHLLALPLMRSDPYLNAFLTEFHEERLARDVSAAPALTARVSDVLTSLLAQGQARLMTVAGEFGMSARTLGRRLAEEGVTFRAILDRLRADLATRYVRDTSMPLSQIAWRLGYKDPSAFIVAFKRWTGKTPSALRREYRP
ncbi:AraC family transcriptional regulator [Methylorubrum sp. SB2]|uniref:AraC family transcriptional regulator n=1 Tax=Methylorubrum subtropicum TaxID=3138812 RepID=UPI00313C1CB1